MRITPPSTGISIFSQHIDIFIYASIFYPSIIPKPSYSPPHKLNPIPKPSIPLSSVTNYLDTRYHKCLSAYLLTPLSSYSPTYLPKYPLKPPHQIPNSPSPILAHRIACGKPKSLDRHPSPSTQNNQAHISKPIRTKVRKHNLFILFLFKKSTLDHTIL